MHCVLWYTIIKGMYSRLQGLRRDLYYIVISDLDKKESPVIRTWNKRDLTNQPTNY